MSEHLPTYKATRSRLSGEKKQNARDILLHEKARVLVTGAGGFIGSALVHALNQRGIQQIVVTGSSFIGTFFVYEIFKLRIVNFA